MKQQGNYHKGNNHLEIHHQKNHKGFVLLLNEWEKHSEAHADLIPTKIRIHEPDHIKLQALSRLYKLPMDELAGSLLQQALEALEAEMPYVAGTKVIRVEEGDEIYEDIGPTPRYLAAQKQVREQQREQQKQQPKKRT